MYAQPQEQDFIRTVIPHLKNGIEHFKALAYILFNYAESENQAIQEVIRKGNKSLDQAGAAASAQLSKVDGHTERLTAQKGELGQRLTNQRKEVENLKSESQCIAECLERSRESLSYSERYLAYARGDLAEVQRKMRESETVRDVGIGIMFIPIIGTIAGAIMVGVSAEDLRNAQEKASATRQEVESCAKAIQYYSNRLAETKRQRKEKKDEIEDCNRTIRQIEQRLTQVSQQRKRMLQVQEKIRSAVYVLDTLAGKATVAKTLTERVVCLPPILNILGEIINLMVQMYENRKYEILSDPQIRAAILSLQEIYKMVSAIDDQDTLQEIQFY